MLIREIEENELQELMNLYMQLHDTALSEPDDFIMDIWKQIMEDGHHHIIVAVKDGRIVASCVCAIILNLTHEQRPYALIENVITDQKYRKQGLATKCLQYAKDIAQKEHCYKIMLMTGSKQESTLRFYEEAGYNRQDKTAFIQWLDV